MDHVSEQGGRGWAVIEIDKVYEDIEGVKCVAYFSTREEAEGRVESLMGEASANHKARIDYTDDYIRNLKSTCRSNSDWKRVLVERFGPHVKDPWRGYDMSVSGYSIHIEMLNTGSSQLGDYHPPVKLKQGDLYVVEVPSCG